MDFVFGAFVLGLDRRELHHSGVVRPLEPKAFTVLAYLCMHRDRAIAKEELLAQCWRGVSVTEESLTRCVRRIRQAVADDGGRQQVIKTLRGYGYRFVAVVEGASPPTPLGPPRCPEDAVLLAQGAPSGKYHGGAAVEKAPAPVWAPGVPHAATPGLSCPHCQTVNRATRQFCAACGHGLWQPCLHCGFGNAPTEHFCGSCGRAGDAPVPVTAGARMGPPRAYTPAHLATKILASQPEVVGERKYATVLVIDIEGVPALHQVESQEAVDDLLNQGFAQLVAEIHRVEDFLTQVTPSGGMALFGVPVACEDHVLRALHAALGMQRAFAAFAAVLHETHGVVLRLRLGIHTGRVVVHAIHSDLRLAYTTLGATVEVATELQQLSQAGAIVVSATVQQQAAGFFRFTALGRQRLPTRAESVSVSTCDGVGAGTLRLEGTLARERTAFQGRTRERALLEG